MQNKMTMFLLDLLYPNCCDCCGSRIPYDLLLCDACTAALRAQRISYADWEKRGQHAVNWNSGTVLFPYDGAARTGVLAMKDGRRGFAQFCAKELAEALRPLNETAPFSCVTFVPVTKRRRRIQGYAHAEYLAGCLAFEMQIPLRGGLLTEHAGSVRQHDLPASEREQYAMRFSHSGADLHGQHVLLTDDILTTGATLRRCTALLLECGAASVSIAAVCAGLGHRNADSDTPPDAETNTAI